MAIDKENYFKKCLLPSAPVVLLCFVFLVVEFHGFVAGYCVVFELDPARNTCVVPAGESPRISELCDVNRNRFSRGAMKTTTTTATRK